MHCLGWQPAFALDAVQHLRAVNLMRLPAPQVLGYADVQQSALMAAHADATAAIGQLQSFQLGQGSADARVHALANAAMRDTAGNSSISGVACSKGHQVHSSMQPGHSALDNSMFP